MKACLPVNAGGLSIRWLEDICLPCFLASVCGVSLLVSALLNSQSTEVILHNEALVRWSQTHGDTLAEMPTAQKQWVEIQTRYQCNL